MAPIVAYCSPSARGATTARAPRSRATATACAPTPTPRGNGDPRGGGRARGARGARRVDVGQHQVRAIAPPRFATPRTPSRFTYGTEANEVARQLGIKLMPHQRLVLDVGLEVDPDTGTFAYRDITVTEPRQGGKSTRILVLLIWRVVRYAVAQARAQRVAYSAQTGFDARYKMFDDWLPMVEDAPAIHALFSRAYRVGGAESLVFGRSRIEAIATTRASAHGKVIDLGVIDEAFADVDERREQALLPAMATRDDAQLWVSSTAGTDDALYLRRKVEQGREFATQGRTEGSAFFEWSAGDDVDLDDPDTWGTFMPALGRTVSVRSVKHAHTTMTTAEFARAFGNRWTRTDEHVIPYVDWLACRDLTASPSGALFLALDARPDRSSSVLVIASDDGAPIIEVVERRQGLQWAVDRVRQLREAHDVREVLVHGGGPAGTLIGALERSGAPLHIVTDAEMVTAAGTMFDLIAEHRVHVRPSDILDDAVAGARRKPRGDAFSWARRSPSTDLSPLVAASLAVWRAVNDEGGALWLYG